MTERREHIGDGRSVGGVSGCRGVRWLLCLLTLALCFGAVSCGGRRDAMAIMQDFSAAYGGAGVLLATEDGSFTTGTYEALYGQTPATFSSCAVWLLSSLREPGECGVFILDDGQDATACVDMLNDRLRDIRKTSLLAGRTPPEGAFVRRYGRVVVYASMPDNALAKKLFDCLM